MKGWTVTNFEAFWVILIIIIMFILLVFICFLTQNVKSYSNKWTSQNCEYSLIYSPPYTCSVSISFISSITFSSVSSTSSAICGIDFPFTSFFLIWFFNLLFSPSLLPRFSPISIPRASPASSPFLYCSSLCATW